MAIKSRFGDMELNINDSTWESFPLSRECRGKMEI